MMKGAWIGHIGVSEDGPSIDVVTGVLDDPVDQHVEERMTWPAKLRCCERCFVLFTRPHGELAIEGKAGIGRRDPSRNTPDPASRNEGVGGAVNTHGPVDALVSLPAGERDCVEEESLEVARRQP